MGFSSAIIHLQGELFQGLPGADREERIQRMRNQDRFRGCLIGGAAGDALGYAVEFLREKQIFSRYGDRGITEYELRNGLALISDDTQMTLFTAAGLLAGTTRGRMRGIMGSYADYIHGAYLDWFNTQEGRYPIQEERRHSWLVNIPELYSHRAPGNTCLSALGSGRAGSTEERINNSKGCGGVMRVAPIGIYFNDRGRDLRDIARIGAEAAALTHGHTLGWMPAAALVQIVHEVSQDDAGIRDAVLHSLDTADDMWPDTADRQYFTRLIRKAVDLAAEDTDDLDAIHQLGEGWVAEETLAIAVFCAVRYADDFDRALTASVNHNGDSDSTGAVCGNILGAKLGLAGIPEKYTENLELKDLILEVADDLYHDCRMSEYDYEHMDPVWTDKYINMTYGERKNKD